MTRQPVESSQIAAIGYDPTRRELDIEFHSRREGVANSVYRYRNVTQDDHAALMRSESIGRHFGQHIKPNAEKYPFEKIQTK